MPRALNPSRPTLRWERKGRSFTYVVTPEDREWFARALWREGKPALAVGFTLLQRFAMVIATYPTLSAFLRAYCQPINPGWFPGGRLSEASIQRALARGDAAAAAAERERAAKRVQYSSTPLAAIPAQHVALADAILGGKLSSPVPTATHFTMSFAAEGDSAAIARQKGEAFAAARGLKLVELPDGYQRGLNWFFRTEATPPTIRFGTSTGSKLATFALLMPWSLLLWWWNRRKG
jgi:hypothetical protein